MRRLFGAAFAASLATLALALPAQAVTRTLGGQTWDTSGATILDFSTAQPPGNQPQNNPCIICGANQPNQTNTNLNFGYTDYGNQGNQTSEVYFSSGILRDTNLASDTISAVNYSGALLKAVVAAIDGGTGTGFSIGIDVNDTNSPQTLESFFLLDLTAHSVVYAFLPGLNDGIDLLAPSNGTGFPDFQLTGLSTLGLIDDHQYAFIARMTNTNDGPDSFFITPGVTAVPLPAVGSGLPMLIAGMVGLVALNRKRKARLGAVA